MAPELTLRLSRLPRQFPNEVRMYRLKAGLSQRDLARAVGVVRSAVSQWERGQRMPSLPHLFKMAKALSTLAESLYFDYYAAHSTEAGVADPRSE